ncbi:short-chain dehydrogenase [Diaporthe amygdali]|uniref:short-chain dehydrogenase n=1 Tax=Phomopsis amygdali TaxID=1214568 RepID=UPI0022FED901|nr:short-chain dehydrogenase [Diaporthe amygdali]KAJ0119054.1 short-chain dehydrogenase [Diaporthe amygdali]
MAGPPFTLPSKYEEVHKTENLAGEGDARPTAKQILKDENRFDGSLNNKVAIVTGCSSGIGVPTVEALAAAGCIVYGGVRGPSMGRAQEALSSVLNDPKTKHKVHLLDLDLTSLASIKAFADEIKKREPRLNLLINNAGVMAVPTRELTKDGFELQFGTNHLSHFYLFQNLKDLLIAGSKASPDFASRVVNVSSSSHRFNSVVFDDINLAKPGNYEPSKSYGNSKTANIWMANHIERLYSSQGIHAYSLMPGGIATPLQKHVKAMMEAIKGVKRIENYMKNTEQGCATTIWAATAHDLEGRGGVYCEDCCVTGKVEYKDDGFDHVATGYAEWAYDPEGEEKLWRVSNELVGLDANA